MSQQVLHRDRPAGALRGNLAVRGLARRCDPEASQLRYVAADGIRQEEVSLLVQHHHRDADDRLGHRADTEDIGALHGITGLEVAHAPFIHPSDLAVPYHHTHRAGDSAFVYVTLEGVSNALQALGRQA